MSSEERRAHWRSMFDNKFLGSWDLPEGQNFAVVIDRVEAQALDIPGTSQKKRKPVVYFVGKRLPMVLNKTNAKAIARMYGDDTRDWKGKAVAIYVTQTQMGEDVVPCLRVRPTPPSHVRPMPPSLPTNGATPEPPPAEEPAHDGHQVTE